MGALGPQGRRTRRAQLRWAEAAEGVEEEVAEGPSSLQARERPARLGGKEHGARGRRFRVCGWEVVCICLLWVVW